MFVSPVKESVVFSGSRNSFEGLNGYSGRMPYLGSPVVTSCYLCVLRDVTRPLWSGHSEQAVLKSQTADVLHCGLVRVGLDVSFVRKVDERRQSDCPTPLFLS
jgi:hypothetical protein